METETILLITAVVWMRFRKGHFLTMLSDGQLHVLNVGDSVFLECSFRADHYSMFDYPVIWRKQQHDELVQMNVMGSLNEPFVSSNRFEVTLNSMTPRYLVELTVLDVAREDSGNYTCEIRGPQSVLLGQVTHQIFVRVSVDRVHLMDDGSTSDESSDSRSHLPPPHPPTFHLVENHPCRIRCISLGGYPPPNIELYIGHRDVTSEFLFRNDVTLTGVRGVRTMTYRTERWTSNYLPRADDNEQLLRCVALVPGLSPVIQVTTLDVDYSPKIVCASRSAFVWEKDVVLRCEVRSKPRVSSLFWVIDNGTTIREGEAVDDFFVVAKDRLDGGVEILLNIRRIRPDSFRRYTLVAENNVAIAAKDVELFQKIKSAEAGSLADVPAVNHVSSRATSRDSRARSSAAGNKMASPSSSEGFIAVHGLITCFVVRVWMTTRRRIISTLI